jgi:hypothetical protein
MQSSSQQQAFRISEGYLPFENKKKVLFKNLFVEFLRKNYKPKLIYI